MTDRLLAAAAARPLLRALVGIESLLAFSMALAGTSVMIFLSRDIGLPTGWLGMIFAAAHRAPPAAGPAIPYISNEVGKVLLYNEGVTR